MESGNWVLVNAMEEKVEGGPFIRQSGLDLWLSTIRLVPHARER